MLIIKRYLSFLLGIFSTIFWEVFIFFPTWLYYIGALYLIFFCLGLWHLQKDKFKKTSSKVSFFILPIIFALNFTAFLSHVNFGQFFFHFFAFVGGILIWFYLETSFLKNYFARFYRSGAWENANEEIILICSFLLFLNFFAFKVYLDWNYFYLFAIAFVMVLLMNWIHLSLNNFLENKAGLYFLFIIPFLVLELLLASAFLPTNFYSLASINTLFFYFFVIFSKFYFSGKFSAKTIKRYSTLAIGLLFFILLASNWT